MKNEKQISLKMPEWLFNKIAEDAERLDRSNAWVARSALLQVYKQEPLSQES